MISTAILSFTLLAAPATSETLGLATAAALDSTPSCVQSIPDSALTRVPVFAVLGILDSPEQAVPPVAANMLQSVVDRVETMLGATPGSLPHGEPGFRWDSIGTGLVIEWSRDGRIDWRLDETLSPLEPPTTKLARLFASALDSARATGELFMPWPSGTPANTIAMKVYFVRPIVDETGKLIPVHERVAIPIFTVAAPRQRGVRVTRPYAPPGYPDELLALGIEGKVTLQFVVDTTGRADTSTMRDLWPKGEPRLEGDKAAYYGQLVARARRKVKELRYVPAETGGCKVRQVVQQPFTWQIR